MDIMLHDYLYFMEGWEKVRGMMTFWTGTMDDLLDMTLRLNAL